MAEWFEEWFNSEEYLYLYKHRNEEDARDLFNLIIKNTALQKSSRVLDLACGAGRYSILFAKHSFDVTGVDLSKNLLSIAKENSSRLGLNINFINQDLRKLNLPEKFHLVINLFTSFGYFQTDEENQKVINFVYNYLIDNGYFILDFFNTVHLRKNLIPVSYDKLADGVIKQERKFEGNRIVKRVLVFRSGQEKIFYESIRAYCKEELVKLLSLSGFNILKVFGDYHGLEFEERTSPRIIIFAQK